jgi:hypothetical protein
MWERILKRTYKIKNSIAFIVNEPVKREIFAADFSDRVVHHLIYNYINPILDAQFTADSYSCRAGKGTHYGVARMVQQLKECSVDYTQDCYVMKLDIQGYFMSINKHLLCEKLQAMLNPVRYTPFNEQESSLCWNDCFDFDLLWWLMDKVIWNEPTQSCIIKGQLSDWEGLPPSKSLFHTKPDCGLPIGNLTSQLFSNVYLHDFDCYVKEELEVEYYGRYVDDFVIMHHSKAFLLDALEKIKRYLFEKSGLVLHPNKIYLQHYSKGFSFLGVYIKPHRCYIGKRTRKKFLATVRASDEKETEKDETGWSRKKMIKVRNSLNSYLGIMKHYDTYRLRRKVLVEKAHEFFKYGYLDGSIHKYSIYKKNLKRK